MIEYIEKAENDGIELPPTTTDQVSQDQIQSMLAQTMKQIETRKKQVQEAVRKDKIKLLRGSGMYSSKTRSYIHIILIDCIVVHFFQALQLIKVFLDLACSETKLHAEGIICTCVCRYPCLVVSFQAVLINSLHSKVFM